SVERNFSRTQSTNDEGGYVFSAIPPGSYRIEIEAAGFKKTAVNDVIAQVDAQREFNIALEVGNIADVSTISVAAESPINTTDASIGNNFESLRIQTLPLNARNIVGLLSLQPGVTRLGEVNGGRRDQANITLDGVDANEQQTGLDVVAGTGNPTEKNGSQNREGFSSLLRTHPAATPGLRGLPSCL